MLLKLLLCYSISHHGILEIIFEINISHLMLISVECPDFKKGVLALAHILNVTPHPDHLITLQAVSKVVRERLSQDALDNPSKFIVKVFLNLRFKINKF